MNTRIIAKAAVFSSSGDVLALKRSKTAVRRPLEWDLPGGFCDLGETPELAIVREIAEEASLKVKDTKLAYAKTEVRTWTDEKGQTTENVIFLFYTARSDTDAITLSYEHSDYQWMPITKALQVFEYALHKEFLSFVVDNALMKS